MSGQSLRVVFFGTPAFAVPTLDAILASSHTVAAVVTQPDRPRGRGQRTSDAPVKVRSVEAGVPVLQPTSLKNDEVIAAVDAVAADIGVVAAYGKILPERLLMIPRLGMINVHASLLPRYRGAAPIHRAVIAGDAETGVTIMRVVKALDAGAMLAAVTVPIRHHETSDQVEEKLARQGAALLVETLDRLAAGPVHEQPQDDEAASYAHRLSRTDSPIDWTRRAEHIHNQIRGLQPWPLTDTFWHGQRLIIRSSDWSDAASHALPGVVVSAHGDDLRVATGSGLLQILQLQAEGKRPMTAREFLAGHHVAAGDHFTREP